MYISLLSHVFLIFSSVLAMLPATLSAQEAHSVTPRLIEEEVVPGSIIKRTITVTNNYPFVINVFPSIHGLVGDIEQRVVPADETPFAAWTAMSRAAQRLQPGATTSINVTFTIDRDTAPGTYQALLGFGQGIDRPTAEAAVVQGIAPAAVVRFVVPEPNVDTTAAAALQIASVILGPRQPGITYSVQNPGRTPLTPDGEILFFNTRGAEVATLPINPNNLQLAPGELLQVATTSPVRSWFGRYDVRARIDFGVPQLSPVTLYDRFWYIPWYVAVMLGGVVLLVGVIIYWRARRALRPSIKSGDGVTHLPLHIYDGQSSAEDHDINLKL